MKDESWLKMLAEERLIAVIRTDEMRIGLKMAMAVAAGGVRLIEITWNSDSPQKMIDYLRLKLPDCVIGVGTLLNPVDLQQAVAVGAEFLFSPHTDFNMIQQAIKGGIPMVPGALSPTEIIQAWSWGATAVKVFPVSAMGGVSYIKSLQGPLGQIPLIPTGGVTLENAAELISAGAVAVGLAGELFPRELLSTGNWEAITKRAQSLKKRLTDLPPIFLS